MSRNKRSNATAAEELPALPVPVGMVSLADQDAELAAMGVTVVEGELVDTGGDAAVSGLPWETWGLPETVDLELGHLSVSVDETERRLLLNVPGFEPAPFGRTIWENLGEAAMFPRDFVGKLSVETAVAVVNERIRNKPQKQLRVIQEGGRWLSLMPGTTEFVPTRRLAETAWNAFQTFGNPTLIDQTEVEPWYEEGRMLLRFLSPKVARVTPRRGDVLRMGVEISQVYGEGIDISLYAERLVCLNGMIAGHHEIRFRTGVSEVKDQLAWAHERILGLEPIFDKLTASAVEMSGRQIPANLLIPEALANFARVNGIHGRLVPLARNAWDRMYREEEDVRPTEWDIANAFTRAVRDVRTYESWPQDVRFNMLERIGEGIRGDQIVIARLRRKDAERVHAEIVSEG